jgi:hypothetical protein
MARESKAVEEIVERLRTITGLRTYEMVTIDKWNTYQFDYVGVLAVEDTREVIGLEDDSAFANRGNLDIYLLVGSQVKKQMNGRANLRAALADICEKVENNLTNFVPASYESDYESTMFAPLHFMSAQVATYDDNETKGLSLMVFRTFYYKS